MKIHLIGIGASDILQANKKLVLAVVWQLVRIHYLQIIGSKTEKDIIAWANASVKD
jgi:plastin-1